MRNAPGLARIAGLSTFIAIMALLVAIAIPTLASAAPVKGGMSAYEYEPTPAPVEETGVPTTESGETPMAGKAMLVNGRAIPPRNAPLAVRQVIAAANKIRTTPYIWGGGHGRWIDRGYDCSGAVSFALHGGRLLSSPLPSGPMATWGLPGGGRWITVYSNANHAYMVVAGLRFDTAGDSGESGPRWHEDTGAAASGTFIARHPVGY
jgi:cell wall-associated NlpC family hydrolase